MSLSSRLQVEALNVSGHPCLKKVSLEEFCTEYQHHSECLTHSQETDSLESSGKAKSLLLFSIPSKSCSVSFAESASGEIVVTRICSGFGQIPSFQKTERLFSYPSRLFVLWACGPSYLGGWEGARIKAPMTPTKHKNTYAPCVPAKSTPVRTQTSEIDTEDTEESGAR